jgi:hypothetical protein
LTHLFNHCFRLAQFRQSWKEAKIITLPKTGKDPKVPQNLRPISLLPTTGKLFGKVILGFLKKHIDEKGLLNASQFGFRALACSWREPSLFLQGVDERFTHPAEGEILLFHVV